MADQQQIAFDYGESLIGYELDVLIDEQVEEGIWQGRCFADAPEIDGTVFVRGENVTVGEFTATEIIATQDYDLIGQAVEE